MAAVVLRNGKVLLKNGKIVVADAEPGQAAPSGCCCGDVAHECLTNAAVTTDLFQAFFTAPKITPTGMADIPWVGPSAASGGAWSNAMINYDPRGTNPRMVASLQWSSSVFVYDYHYSGINAVYHWNTQQWVVSLNYRWRLYDFIPGAPDYTRVYFGDGSDIYAMGVQLFVEFCIPCPAACPQPPISFPYCTGLFPALPAGTYDDTNCEVTFGLKADGGVFHPDTEGASVGYGDGTHLTPLVFDRSALSLTIAMRPRLWKATPTCCEDAWDGTYATRADCVAHNPRCASDSELTNYSPVVTFIPPQASGLVGVYDCFNSFIAQAATATLRSFYVRDNRRDGDYIILSYQWSGSVYVSAQSVTWYLTLIYERTVLADVYFQDYQYAPGPGRWKLNAYATSSSTPCSKNNVRYLRWCMENGQAGRDDGRSAQSVRIDVSFEWPDSHNCSWWVDGNRGPIPSAGWEPDGGGTASATIAFHGTYPMTGNVHIGRCAEGWCPSDDAYPYVVADATLVDFDDFSNSLVIIS